MQKNRGITWLIFSKIILFIIASLCIVSITEVRICYADYSGTVISYNIPNSITNGEGLNVSIEIKNNGTENWIAYAQNFPYPKYLPSFRVNITNMSWAPNKVYSYAQMYHVNAAESIPFSQELLQELPTETGEHSFTIECEYHSAYSSDIYTPMTNSPIKVTFFIIEYETNSRSIMPWLMLLLE